MKTVKNVDRKLCCVNTSLRDLPELFLNQMLTHAFSDKNTLQFGNKHADSMGYILPAVFYVAYYK